MAEVNMLDVGILLGVFCFVVFVGVQIVSKKGESVMNQVEFSVSVYCNEEDFAQVRDVVEEEVNKAAENVKSRIGKEQIKNTHVSAEDVSEVEEED